MSDRPWNRHGRFPAEIQSLSAPDLVHYASRCLLRIQDAIQSSGADGILTLNLDDLKGDLITNAANPVGRLRVVALERGSIEWLMAAQALAQEVTLVENILTQAMMERHARIAAAQSGNLGMSRPGPGSPLL